MLPQIYSTKSMKEKRMALDDLSKGMSNKEIARKYNVPKTTLSTWLKNKEKILKACNDGHLKRRRIIKSHFQCIDEETYNWFCEGGSTFQNFMIKEKALDIARNCNINNFKASDGWLMGWKRRNLIPTKNYVPGGKKVHQCFSDSTWYETTLPALLNRYELREIFNIQQFEVLHRVLPTNKYDLNKESRWTDTNHKNVRLGVMVVASACGEKLPILIAAGKRSSHSFRYLRYPSYKTQINSFTGLEIFEDMLQELDRRFVKEERKVVIIMSYCPSGIHLENLKAINLVFIPNTATFCTRPMFQGITSSLKEKYRIVSNCRMNEPDFQKTNRGRTVGAMRMLMKSWDEVSVVTIVNVFKKAGICKPIEQHK